MQKRAIILVSKGPVREVEALGVQVLISVIGLAFHSLAELLECWDGAGK